MNVVGRQAYPGGVAWKFFIEEVRIMIRCRGGARRRWCKARAVQSLAQSPDKVVEESDQLAAAGRNLELKLRVRREQLAAKTHWA